MYMTLYILILYIFTFFALGWQQKAYMYFDIDFQPENIFVVLLLIMHFFYKFFKIRE